MDSVFSERQPDVAGARRAAGVVAQEAAAVVDERPDVLRDRVVRRDVVLARDDDRGEPLRRVVQRAGVDLRRGQADQLRGRDLDLLLQGEAHPAVVGGVGAGRPVLRVRHDVGRTGPDRDLRLGDRVARRREARQPVDRGVARPRPRGDVGSADGGAVDEHGARVEVPAVEVERVLRAVDGRAGVGQVDGEADALHRVGVERVHRARGRAGRSAAAGRLTCVIGTPDGMVRRQHAVAGQAAQQRVRPRRHVIEVRERDERLLAEDGLDPVLLRLRHRDPERAGRQRVRRPSRPGRSDARRRRP